MTLFDLTHPVCNQTPVYPGELSPDIRNITDLENRGYREKWLSMGSHTGTHLDAPAHMLTDGKTLDQFPVSHFSGKAVFIPVQPGTGLIEVSHLKPYSDRITDADYVLLHTGWSRFWGTGQYFRDFPVLSDKAAGWLATFSLKGIGVDTISVDAVESDCWPVHKILFNAGMVIVENLTFSEIGNYEKAVIHCFPLKIEGADGSPVRAVLEM
jgi:arylformamidase